MGGCGASSAPEHLRDEANLLQICGFWKAATTTHWLADLNPQEIHTAQHRYLRIWDPRHGTVHKWNSHFLTRGRVETECC